MLKASYVISGFILNTDFSFYLIYVPAHMPEFSFFGSDHIINMMV